MKQAQKSYGYIYDKKGNLKAVNPPIYGNGKPVNEKHITRTDGKIPNGVGYPGFPSNAFNHMI